MRSQRLPDIRIKDAWLLRENASRHLHELWGRDEELADDSQMEQTVAAYTEAWQPHEHIIMAGMCKTLGLRFRQNLIDVYIAPWFHAFSDPLVVGVKYEPDIFIDILTHELLHRLLTDNTTVPYDIDLSEEWGTLFGTRHTPRTLAHIPVHAAHTAIYLDVLQEPQRLQRNIARNPSQDYIRAWNYVDQHGYRTIIEQLRESYEKLGKHND